MEGVLNEATQHHSPLIQASSQPKKRFLLMTTAYGKGQVHAPLVESLADLLASDGHDVDVVAIDWNASPNGPARRYREASGANVLLLAPRRLSHFGARIALISKWVWSSISAARSVRRELADKRYDLVFVMTPAVTLAALILWALRRARFSYAYITDFFPYHHASVGLIPGGTQSAALWLETALLKRFDVLACISPLGIDYLNTRYRLRPEQIREVLPLWGDISLASAGPMLAIRQQYGLPIDRSIIVFGGQITAGRGIEEILEAARLARRERPDLFFLIVGSGRLEPLVRDYIAAEGDNLSLMAPLGRDAYLSLISACDIGLVATVAHVDVPTFPSKTIDYLRAGIPVVASVERTTDYDKFVEQRGFGVAIEAGDPERLLAAIISVVDDPAAAVRMKIAARRTLVDVFDVTCARDRILASLPVEIQE